MPAKVVIQFTKLTMPCVQGKRRALARSQNGRYIKLRGGALRALKKAPAYETGALILGPAILGHANVPIASG